MDNATKQAIKEMLTPSDADALIAELEDLKDENLSTSILDSILLDNSEDTKTK